jgi:arginase
MRVSLIAVPYDLGRADVGSGRGPGAYLQAGAAEALRARGHDVDVVTVRRGDPFTEELQAVLAVDAAVAAAVESARGRGSLPLVLAGNCNAALGVRAGLERGGGADAALVWLDAHGDFNSPATTETGYLDGMPLAMICGRAHRDVVAGALGVAPLSEEVVVHAGGREFDRQEEATLTASGVRVVDGGELRGRGPAAALAPALDAIKAAAGAGDGQPPAHLHVDLDVLDPTAAPGVTFPSPHGLSAAQLLEAIDLVRARFALAAVTIASFTPERDDAAGTTLAAGLAVIHKVTAGEASRRP